jgi:hypothetical protein
VVHEEKPRGGGVEVTTLPVAPAEAGDGRWENEAHEGDQVEVVLVLPPDDLVLAEVADVRDPRLAARLEDHPTNVGVPEAFVGVVRVKVGVGVAMVGAMTARPPLDRALDGASADDSENVLKCLGRVIGAVRPKTVVASRDT